MPIRTTGRVSSTGRSVSFIRSPTTSPFSLIAVTFTRSWEERSWAAASRASAAVTAMVRMAAAVFIACSLAASALDRPGGDAALRHPHRLAVLRARAAQALDHQLAAVEADALGRQELARADV